MNIKLYFLGMSLGLMVSCAGMKPAAVEPVPQRVTIYSSSYAMAEVILPGAALISPGLRLPVGTDLDSLSVFTKSQRLTNVTLEEESQGSEKKSPQGLGNSTYLLRLTALPQTDEGLEVHVKFGIFGVSFSPSLEMELTTENSANLNLKALITALPLDLHESEIFLASRVGRGPSGERIGSDVVYPLGKLSIPKGRASHQSVFTQTAAFEARNFWDTSTVDMVKREVRVANPFPVPLWPTTYRISKSDQILADGNLGFTLPAGPLSFEAGAEPKIEIYRSIVTKENPASKTTPFNHHITYVLKNNLDHDTQVTVIFHKKIGVEHRIEYNFQRPPTARPGNYILWDVKVPKAKSETVEFDFDSEEPVFNEYANYENSMAQ